MFTTEFLCGVAATLILATVALIAATAWLTVKKCYRRRKNDARIIRQAKAMDMWNTKAGGRALELYAKEWGLKRYPGETDRHLRCRITEAIENGSARNG